MRLERRFIFSSHISDLETGTVEKTPPWRHLVIGSVSEVRSFLDKIRSEFMEGTHSFISIVQEC